MKMSFRRILCWILIFCLSFGILPGNVLASDPYTYAINPVSEINDVDHHLDIASCSEHNMGEWYVYAQPDEMSDGEKRRECKNCDYYETQVIDNNPFTDVEDGRYYSAPILWAYYQGITTGASETVFRPNEACTRGQVVTFLWRANGCPEPERTDCPFTDVDSSAYYYKAVLWALEKDIVKGTSDTTFSPDEICTRAQAMTFLWRALECPAPSSMVCKFNDVPAGKYYYEAVLWAVENEVTKGTTDFAFSPSVVCTRGQIVTFLYKALST